jgi:hypothetical protein
MPALWRFANYCDERAKIGHYSQVFTDQVKKYCRKYPTNDGAFRPSYWWNALYLSDCFMEPVKINIFISCVWEDRPYLETLLQWLYPMRDEVNFWYNDPPPRPPMFSLPWQLLLFWYRRRDPRAEYGHVLENQLNRAHVYLFMTSYKSVIDPSVEHEISTAVQRYIAQGDKYVRIHPLLLKPSQWKTQSRLARFKPIGMPAPISQLPLEDEGWLAIAEELKSIVHQLQRNLNELRQFKQLSEGSGQLPAADTGEDAGAVYLDVPEPFDPPEWLGWSIIIGLIMLTLVRLGPQMPTRANKRYQNVPPPESRPPEYLREQPLAPVPDSLMPKTPRPDTPVN